jgi:hypothetical protein
LVTATATSVSTKCCYQITQPSLPTSLYELRTSAVLTASAPALGVGVNVTRMYCAGASSAAMCTTKLVNSSVCVADATGLLLRPRTSFYAFTTSTSATFALYASKGGCTKPFTHSAFPPCPICRLMWFRCCGAGGCFLLQHSLSGRLASSYSTPADQAIFIYSVRQST